MQHLFHIKNISKSFTYYKQCAKYSILFFGGDTNSIPSLETIYYNAEALDLKDLLVICPPDKPAGRGLVLTHSAVKDYCLKKDIPFVEVPHYIKSLKYWDLQLDHQYDFGVVVSFRYLIRPNILKFIRYNTINAHPSILPRYRGPAPIYQQILHNEENSGVSIIEIDPSKFDNGKIIKQVPFTIRQTMTYPQLAYHLDILMARCLLDVLLKYPQSFNNVIEQDEKDATYAPILPKNYKLINWSEMTGQEVYNRWRVFLAVHTHHKKRLVLLKHLDPPFLGKIKVNGKPGDIYYDKKLREIYIKCKDDWIRCNLFQFQNKSELRSKIFYNQIKNDPHFH